MSFDLYDQSVGERDLDVEPHPAIKCWRITCKDVQGFLVKFIPFPDLEENLEFDHGQMLPRGIPVQHTLISIIPVTKDTLETGAILS